MIKETAGLNAPEEQRRLIGSADIRLMMSPYLDGGWQQERFSIESALINESSIAARLVVERFVPDYSGRFHFSGAQAYVWLQQLGIVYICCDMGLAKEELGEVIFRESRLRFRRAVTNSASIKLEINFIQKKSMRGMRCYTGDVDVECGAMVGDFTCLVYPPAKMT